MPSVDGVSMLQSRDLDDNTFDRHEQAGGLWNTVPEMQLKRNRNNRNQSQGERDASSQSVQVLRLPVQYLGENSMQLATATKTEALLYNHYKGVRERLWITKKPPVKELPEPEPAVEPVVVKKTPRWEKLECTRTWHINRIIEECMAEFGVKKKEFHGPSRKKPVVEARRMAAYRLRTEIVINGEMMSFPQIGRAMGGFHHTTIFFHVKKHCALHGLTLPKVVAKHPRRVKK